MSVQHDSNARFGAAIAFFSLGIFLFAANDALGKWLVTGYPIGQLLLFRTFGAALFLVPVLIRNPASLRVTEQVGLHVIRVLVWCVDTFAFYFAVRTLPLADVMTFYLAAPLFITALAVIWLQERIGWMRSLALVIGFLGVVVALRPSGEAFAPGAIVALLGCLAYSSAFVLTRRLRQTHWVTLVAWQFGGAGIIGAMASTQSWVQPTLLDAGLMVLVGLVSMGCFICINHSVKLATASLLAPFQYTAIIWAVLFGWLVWGDMPEPRMWLGIALIIASGSAVWMLERRSRRRRLVQASV